MNYLYAINFVPGFEDLVGQLLKGLDAEAVLSEEAFCIVKLKEKLKPRDYVKFNFAKNVVQLLEWSGKDGQLNLNFDVDPNDFELGGYSTFNLRNFESAKPTKMDSSIRDHLTSEISKKFNLEYRSFNPDVDFVLAKRRGGVSYFGVKLKLREKISLQKGELDPDVANLLLELGGIKNADFMLDAFAGNGGISKEALRSFGAGTNRGSHNLNVILVEKSSRLVNRLKVELDKKLARVIAGDVVKFLNKTDKVFDLVVADPPWGDFEDYPGGLEALEKLYLDFLEAAKGKISKDGIITIMSSKKEVLERAAECSGLKLEASLNILVSGNKVLVLKLRD